MTSTSVFNNVLLAIGIGFIAAGTMHVVFGLGADQILGASVSTASHTDPGLDSQNRFYGAAFTLYGVLLLVIRRDVAKYETILRCLLWVFWFAGGVRFVSVALYGWPPYLMGVLFAVELILPPALLFWTSRLANANAARGDPHDD